MSCTNGDNVCVIDPDAPSGNMYYRGKWQYCPEYDTGDVVLYKGEMYVSVKHNAGKEPSSYENREYWQKLSSAPPEPPPDERIILCGGYASTGNDGEYDALVLGGSSSGRVHIPLV